MTTPFSTVHDVLTSDYEVGSTSKEVGTEAGIKKLTKEVNQAQLNLTAEQYYQATNLMSLFGYKAPPGTTPPTTLTQAIQDVESGATLSGWTAPPSPPATPSIPWWVYALIGVIVIGVIVALVS